MKSGPYFVLTIGLAGDPVSESNWIMNDDERETCSGIKNCMRMTKKTECKLWKRPWHQCCQRSSSAKKK